MAGTVTSKQGGWRDWALTAFSNLDEGIFLYGEFKKISRSPIFTYFRDLNYTHNHKLENHPDFEEFQI